MLAGGQSLIPLMKLRLAEPEVLVDLNGVDELTGIEERDDYLRIGAMTRHAELESSALIRSRYPLIADAAPRIADPLVRNRGTTGGSLAHADPAGDLGSVMTALGAEVVIAGPGGERTTSVDDLLLGPFTTSLEPNEILTEVRVPAPAAHSGGAYVKFERKVGDFATAAVAVQLARSNGTCEQIGIALTAVGPTSIRASAAEDSLRGGSLDEQGLRTARRLGRRSGPAGCRSARTGRVQARPGARPSRCGRCVGRSSGQEGKAMAQIEVTVNGTAHAAEVEPRLLLVHFLREDLTLTGTHIGCDTTHCGACTVLLDGVPVKSCTVFAVQANGSEIATVEGLEQDGNLHPVQAAFVEEHGLQCGFCTPGMMITASALLEQNSNPTEEEIRNAISGNLCRCTGYVNIVKSVQHAAREMAGS